MFTYIKVNNFKSLVDLNVDFCSKKDTPKKVILIYGENGVGKSNLVSIFVALSEFIQTLSISKTLNKIISGTEKDNTYIADLFKSFIKFKNNIELKDTESIIKKYKTINSEESMSIEVGFKIHDKVGSYKIETNNTSIISEKLEYVIDKNKTEYFSITENTGYLNESIFKRKTYSKELKNLIEQFWGKHSLLSIIAEQMRDKNTAFIEQVLCEGILSVVAYFDTICTNIKGIGFESTRIDVSHEILNNLQNGVISVSEKNKLKRAENFLFEFFTHSYSDIKDVYYKTTPTEDKIKYNLYLKKQVYGKILDIPFSNESTGTHKLIELLPMLIACVEGRTVIIDEFDSGIHDVLLSKLFESFLPSARGQIIITTHSTMLLESEIPKQSIYVFDVDSHGKKELIALTKLERTHPNQSIRKRYVEGLYGGVPSPMTVDFDDLLAILEK